MARVAWVITAVLLGACLLARSASATVVTFAQFTNQSTSSHNNLQFSLNGVSKANPNGTSASLHAFNQGTGDPVFFSFTSFVGDMPAGLQGPQSAVLRFNAGQGATTTLPARTISVPILGTYTQQPFDGAFSINFFRSTDFVYRGKDYGRNLLTITLSPVTGGSFPSLIGSAGSKVHSATMSWDSTTFNVSYTSDFLKFPEGADLDGAFSFSSILPLFALASGKKFITPFTADVTGSFDSDPPPVSVFAVPEPSAAALLAGALTVLAGARVRTGAKRVLRRAGLVS